MSIVQIVPNELQVNITSDINSAIIAPIKHYVEIIDNEINIQVVSTPLNVIIEQTEINLEINPQVVAVEIFGGINNSNANVIPSSINAPTRNAEGFITQLILANGEIINITRDSSQLISEIEVIKSAIHWVGEIYRDGQNRFNGMEVTQF